MGDLPADRVNPPKRALEATEVDYTGAIEIKSSRYRGHTCYKAYVAVLICLASKAIQLEAVTRMSAQHFLWALQRFIGRRGFCQHLYSDCGTNFISSDKSLNLWTNEFYQGIEDTVVPELTRPSFGGLWESNVKAHLHRSFKGIQMTYEQLSTILVQIEACLNSRPLCPLTSLDDLQALTPGHFLIGDSMMALPEPSPKDSSLNTEFLNSQRMFRLLWRKWSADWLPHLQARPKWRHETDNLQCNDMIIIKDDRTSPSDWKLERIIDLNPGTDGLVRVATVKTSTGIYKRSVSKICRLSLPRITEESRPSTKPMHL